MKGSDRCRLDFPSPNSIRSIPSNVSLNSRTAAILIEPIQGEGGIRPCDAVQFLSDFAHLADRLGLLLMFDGVQCSLGRTGDFFSYETYGVVPDVSIGQGLGRRSADRGHAGK